MIPERMKKYLSDALPAHVWDTRLKKDGPRRYLEFGPLDVDRLQRLGIRVDRLAPGFFPPSPRMLSIILPGA